jgi:hypothetical protein
MAKHPDSKVAPLRGARHAGHTNAKRRDLPLGPELWPTIESLLKIAALSGDHLVGEGPVHPDFRLLELCATTLDLFRQADEVGTWRQHRFKDHRPWTDSDRARADAEDAQRLVFEKAAVRLLKRTTGLKATTAAGIYAKALVVKASLSGAALCAQSLAEDLIACDGLRRSLIWPGDDDEQHD